jgi:hypothetical protein
MVSSGLIDKAKWNGLHVFPLMAFVKMSQKRHTHETIVEVWTCVTLKSRAKYHLQCVNRRATTLRATHHETPITKDILSMCARNPSRLFDWA